MFGNTRDIFIRRLREDLVGPGDGKKEEIFEYPTDRYLTGILYPQNENMAREDDESLEIEVGNAIQEGRSGDEISVGKSYKPTTAGISFSLQSEENPPLVTATIECGMYNPYWVDDQGTQYTERPNNKKTKILWKRTDVSKSIPLKIKSGTHTEDLTEHGLSKICLFVRASRQKSIMTVTLQAYNSNKFEASTPYHEKERCTLFQFKMKVSVQKRTIFYPRPVHSYVSSDDEDTSIATLIYREIKEYATGHNCSATWNKDKEGNITTIETEWIPLQKVHSVNSNGDEIFDTEFHKNKMPFPTAKFLSEQPKKKSLTSLKVLVGSFEKWLEKERQKIDSLDDNFRKQAQDNINKAQNIAVTRMKAGIDLLEKEDNVYKAFQLANQAMQIQSAWKSGFSNGIPETKKSILQWRPFQLSFVLMTLHSLVKRDSEHRNVMDLIWFPTGGGKTEAYLLLTAFTLFYRRIYEEGKISAYGVAVFMRYTLRTLTIQQFERAASLITACEFVRNSSSEMYTLLGKKRFSIGLWVGENSTPNKYEKAVECIVTNDENTSPAQIEKCPACNGKITWCPDDERKSILAICENEDCDLSEIPVMTVDDQIYEELPSLIIGTVDKFAQIVRQNNAVKLFGLRTPHNPPDLIIQDELHLISGPLGTIVGVYEIAIDKFCSLEDYKPKIIGSTATIRRAKEQVSALFDRKVYQFPPPIIDADNSCFAKTDSNSAGRVYVGITTAGRSQKFALQAVAASLIQSINDRGILEEESDNFSTLVAYFNSLKVLGGALIVMQNEVEMFLKAYAARRGENKRELNAPEEMTSRKKSKEIPKILERLKLKKENSDFIDVLLATNMLSVGVDIPRLGLMLVAGQPKTMSEYIQATSRVGRQNVPGLIVTLYNNNKIRDRAHYENFKTWHQSLYRELEGSSVTPFAARARDKVLHAALIVLARYMIPELNDKPVLTPKLRQKIEELVVPYIMDRVKRIDDREVKDTAHQLNAILNKWEYRDGLKSYWGRKDSLLTSADDVAQLYAVYNKKAEGISTPNTMRNVEAQTSFFLKEFSRYNSKTGIRK